MDARHFDALARALTENGTRRSLLSLLATLPVVGAFLIWISPEAEAKDRRRRRKTRHKKRHNSDKSKQKRKRKKTCTPEAQATTCTGKCGQVTNNCNETVDCGSCDCIPACPECKTCHGAPGVCVPSTAGTPCGAAQSCTNGIVTAQATCDGTGTCLPGAQTECDPYTKCNPAGADCATTCADDNDCVVGSFCNDQNHCVGDLPIGELCDGDGECSSGHCAQGVCCDTACDSGCHACDLQGSKGTCTTLSDGSTCGSGDICCAGVCEEGVCCSSTMCTDVAAPGCVDHDCVCPANSNIPCSNGMACCGDGCFFLHSSNTHCGSCETACGPGQTCQNGVCGVVCGSDFCPASSEICFNGECKTCDITCPEGTCSGDALRTRYLEGGTVYVCPGRYTGAHSLGKSVNIIGAGQGNDERSDTILDAQQQGRVITVGLENTYELHRLRITGGTAGLGGGVRNFRDCTLTMTDCTITGNNNTSEPSGNRGGGIDVINSTTTLIRCTISNNKATSDELGETRGGGVAFSFAGSLTMTDCKVMGNEADDAGGVYGGGNNPAELTNTFVWNNSDPQCAGDISVFGTGGCGVAPPG